LHLLGVLHFQGGRMDEADAVMRRSIGCPLRLHWLITRLY
jgi:hypothetical protein